jgi:plastocyanin
MAVPKVLYALPILVIGALVPGLTHATSLPHRPNLVGMEQDDFNRSTVVLRVGQKLELANNSNFLHVVAAGSDARVARPAGEPSFGTRGVVSVPRGTVYQTLAWEVPGTYHVTCTLHPNMNLTVIVVAAGAPLPQLRSSSHCGPKNAGSVLDAARRIDPSS